MLSRRIDEMAAASADYNAALEASNLAEKAAFAASTALSIARGNLQAELESLVKHRKGDDT